MRKIIGSGAVLGLLLLVSQVAYAQYEPSGPLDLSATTPSAGSPVHLEGSGYAPNSAVTITIESTPKTLVTTTTDATGSFSVTVTIPGGYSGAHTLVATGVAPDGSVRTLASPIEVAVPDAPNTSAASEPVARQRADSFVLAFAGAGIAIVSLMTLMVIRRRSSPGA